MQSKTENGCRYSQNGKTRTLKSQKKFRDTEQQENTNEKGRVQGGLTAQKNTLNQ